MKIYFAASVRGYSHYREEYKSIQSTLNSLNQKLTSSFYKEDEAKQFYDKLEMGGSKAYNDFFNETIDTIKNSDINVFECTMPSLGIGFQVEKSLEFNKPTIVLYLKGHIPHFFAGTENEKMLLKEYTAENIEKILTQAINDARHLADKRFNFFISPFLLTYLETTSKKEGITKSTFIRNLIHDHMKKKKK